MSNPSSSGHDGGHDHGPAHGGPVKDDIDYVKLIAIGLASLALFAVATYWAFIILRQETTRIQEQTGKSKAVMVGRDEIGIVDQVPFVADHRLDNWRAARAAHLQGTGWVDRSKGIVHIPIETAMDQVAAGAAPAGAPK